MNEPVSDMELERFLRRRDRLSQEYAALGSEGPPAELDTRVLERARRALDEDVRSPFWRRANWPRITALAATVVLSFALVVRLAIDNEMPVPSAAGIENEVTSVPPAEPARAAPPSDDVRYGGRDDRSVPFDVPAPAPAPPSAETAIDQRPAPATTQETHALRSTAMRPPTEAVGQAAASESPMQKYEAESLPLSDEARQRLERREAALAKRTQAPAQRDMAVQEEKAAAPMAPRESRPPDDETQGERAGSANATRKFVVTGSAISKPDPDSAQHDPQQWFEEIQRLRADGHTEEADREMEKLRAAHPDFKPAQEPAPTR